MSAWPLGALVQRARTGDHEAFSALYEHYRRPLQVYLHRLLGDWDTAEDLAQDTLIKAWQALPSSGSTTNTLFQAWAYRIATNKAMDAVRHAKVLKWLSLDCPPDWSMLRSGDDSHESIGRPKTWDFVVAPDDPESDALREELRAEVRAVLAQLQPRYRQILQLYAMLGAGHGAQEEVGALLGMKPKQAKGVIYRARQEYLHVAAGEKRPGGKGSAAPAVPIKATALRTWRRSPQARQAVGSIYFHRDGRTKAYHASCGRRHDLGRYATLEEAKAALAAFHAQQDAEAA